MEKQNRFKSPVVWGAVVAQLAALLVTLGVFDIGKSEAIQAVAMAIVSLLTVFGVLNNPTDKTNF